jgi:hypothetical protein
MGKACAEHHYRVYDPYYSDYHVWNDDEVVHYHSGPATTTATNTETFASFLPRNKKSIGLGVTAAGTTITIGTNRISAFVERRSDAHSSEAQ